MRQAFLAEPGNGIGLTSSWDGVKGGEERGANMRKVFGRILSFGLEGEKWKKEAEKYYDYYQLLSHWLEIKNGKRSAAEYFHACGIRTVAVYGMGEIANRLCEDLEGSGIEIVCGIDRDICNTIARIREIYSPEGELPAVEAVVVTPFYAFDAVRELLVPRVNGRIISIEEVIWSL